MTPNPRKLHSIGKELDKLGRTINDMTPVSELPFNVRPKSRKEKNKLASRACRLKKKAQHEANKIKLFGLETEHSKYQNNPGFTSNMKPKKCAKTQFDFPFSSFFLCTERLINGIFEIKKALAYKFGRPTENTEDVNTQIETVANSATSKYTTSPYYSTSICIHFASFHSTHSILINFAVLELCHLFLKIK